MSDDPIFLSEYHVALLQPGLAIRLKTIVAPVDAAQPVPKPGPTLEFLISAEQATSFAQSVLEAVDDWKATQRH